LRYGSSVREIPEVNDVFDYRNRLIDEYSAFSRSFSTIAASDLAAKVGERSCDAPPSTFGPYSRAILRTELAAYLDGLYGLTLEAPRRILDPDGIAGACYPADTIRLLRTNERREFGEHRTRRLVLGAWDRQHQGESKLC